MSYADAEYTGRATQTYASSGTGYGSSAADAYDTDVAASSAAGYGSSSGSGSSVYDTSTATATATDFSSQLIKQTESHWSVSGTSVISAWGACLVGGIIIILIFSRYRTRKPLIFLPRYRQLVAKELLVHKSRRQGNYHALIPSSDPKKDLEKEELEYEVADATPGGAGERGEIGGGRVRLKHVEEQAPFFGWLRPAWHDFKVELKFWNSDGAKQRDERILKTLGLDAFTMLEFLRLFRWLFALISVFVAIPLLCANYFINTQTRYGSTLLTLDSRSSTESGNGSGNGTIASTSTTGVTLNNMTSVIGDLQLYTAANIKGDGLWVHIMADFAVTLLVVLQVRIYARRHDRAIEQWSDMNQNEVSFKTIMLTRLEISRKLNIHQAKLKIHRWIHPKPADREKAAECRIDLKQENMAPFYEKFEFWNETEHGRAAAAAQRIIDMQKRADEMKRKEAKDEGDGSDEKDGSDAEGGKTGKGGGNGQGQKQGKEDDGEPDVQGGCAWWNMDALKSDYDILRESVGVFSTARQNQKELRRQEAGGELVADVTAAFVTWRTAREAHTVLQRLMKDKDLKFKVERTPRNNCVIWRNLEKDPATLFTHRITGRILRIIITVVNSLPLLFITVLANLDALTRRWPRLQTLRESSKFWEAVFTAAAGILPAGLAALFVLALPHLMRFLSHWQGALSRGQMDQDVIKQMFLFMLVSKFVVFSLLGVGYETYLSVADKFGHESAQDIFESLGDVPAKVTRAYISQSSYWLSFFPSALTCLNLLQPVRWLMKFWAIYITREANTRDRIDEVAEPPEFELFGMVVALVYTPLAPLIALCGTLYFWIASIVMQNQLTYVEKTVETDGKAWRVVMNRLLAGLGCMQGLMILTSSTVSLGVRLAPLIISILPTGLTFHLARHVRNKRGAAEIISSRSAMLDTDPSSTDPESSSSSSYKARARARAAQQKGEVPRFEHEILNKGSLRTVSVFDADVPLLAAGLNRVRGAFALRGGKLQSAWPDHVYADARRLIPQYGKYMAEQDRTAEQREAARVKAEKKRKREEVKRKKRERRERARREEEEKWKMQRQREKERRQKEREEWEREEKRREERRRLREVEERVRARERAKGRSGGRGERRRR